MRSKVQQLVKDLDADDWQQRDAAEKDLVKLGPSVAGTLRQVRDKQPPEAQQRIDAVPARTEKVGAGAPPPGAAGGDCRPASRLGSRSRHRIPRQTAMTQATATGTGKMKVSFR